jgi:hypothetical protein
MISVKHGERALVAKDLASRLPKFQFTNGLEAPGALEGGGGGFFFSNQMRCSLVCNPLRKIDLRII